mmetsp:Transcript_27358/g.26157  ORF Transcript_27358/g.26157 Transcript_27358/m.26157 type:complete len:473 (+) Transcript_27358:170-1588(+)
MLIAIVVFSFLRMICAAFLFQENRTIDEIFVPPISYTNRNFEKSGFSAHHCVGGNDYATGASERSCVFFNVCHLEGEDDIIHYYVDPSKLRTPVYSEGLDVKYNFAPYLVYRGAYSYPKWATPGTWAPIIDQHKSPEGFSYEKSEYSIFFQGFAETNFGEFINLLHTLYVLPLLHGYVPSTNMTLLDGDSPVNKTVLSHKFRRQLLHKGITQHKPIFLRSAGNKCYKTLFVGSGMLSVLHGSMLHAMTVDKLRNYILKNLEFKPPELAINNRHRILILLKTFSLQKIDLKDTENATSGYSNHENHILNADKLVSYLSHELREIADITTMTPDEYSISYQIYNIQNSTVVITAPGGGSFGALFTRQGASLVILDRFYGRHGSQRFISGYNGREDSWWTHMHSINLLHYPVCDPAEQGGDDGHDHIVVLSRMLHVSVLAMQAAENRYDHLENAAALSLLAKRQGLMSDLCSIKT